MKIGKSHVFVLILALIIIYAAFISGSGGYCSAREFFSGRHDEEDDACIAKLVKRADDGNSFAESRLRYPTMEYIKRVCEKGVENLSERERYYFQGFGGDRCEIWGFKTPKSKGGEANTTSDDTNVTSGERNLTRAEANNGEARTTGSKADKTKREGNSTEEQNTGR
ncbi:hypothetical protein [Campylobacter gracilis]|uniref:Uncharacterized protein n=1 Tax=Campylobacter gracilis RM3268 TaxID=553220 RepID=C8PIP4_9BACT|nr:hypothetical protein [Campylobacter gracilis]AKT92034.1 hypothetical protein CGRAC_0578 [Campylobacter gracilis]EEV17409.1 hypothetical protein CAMGR0001_1705 [Campylobacter gracilis RM3268]UEB45772.1 hypothetical protein LK410_01335 [Campylobacter gracilis]SUW81546.1 Uncharacterised protein [Campylobacter gracilis]